MLKAFPQQKKAINKMKRQPMEWYRIFANAMTDKVLVSKIYKQLIQLNIKKNNPIKPGQNAWRESFSKTTYRWPTGRWKDDQHY